MYFLFSSAFSQVNWVDSKPLIIPIIVADTTTKSTRSVILIKSKFDSFNYRSYKKAFIAIDSLEESLMLLILTSLDLGYVVWAQQTVFGQDSFENTSNQTGNRLDAIIELLEQ